MVAHIRAGGGAGDSDGLPKLDLATAVIFRWNEAYAGSAGTAVQRSERERGALAGDDTEVVATAEIQGAVDYREGPGEGFLRGFSAEAVEQDVIIRIEAG